MALRDFFEDQLEEIRAFLEFPGPRLRAILHDGEMRPVLLRMLKGLEDDEDCPHLMLASQPSFHDEDQYCRALLADLEAAVEEHRAALAGAGVEVPRPSPERDDAPTGPRDRFSRYFAALADAMPDQVGTLALVIEPETVSDRAAFAATMAALAEETSSDWAKYIVLDSRSAPLLAGCEEVSRRASVQEFYLAPEAIEAGIRRDLENEPFLSPKERLQYTAMLGTFAAARKETEQAMALQREALAMAESEGGPIDRANAHYNLGNTHLDLEEFEAAEEHFAAAASIAVDAQLTPTLAMALTNLGVALQRQGRIDEALAMFDAARRNFQAVRNPPGEAHVLDCKAKVFELTGHEDQAEAAWLEARAVYEGITGSFLQDVRAGGVRDIQGKLDDFYARTGRARLARPGEAGASDGG
jgi:tetratricopeptide (TPR) repeat protein